MRWLFAGFSNTQTETVPSIFMIEILDIKHEIIKVFNGIWSDKGLAVAYF
jgi:hypothetical protein